jgi:hypothetical protein
LCFPGRHFFSWTMLPALFALVILETSLTFCPHQPWLQSSHFMLAALAEMTGKCNHSQIFSHWDEDLANFFFSANLEPSSSQSQPPK